MSSSRIASLRARIVRSHRYLLVAVVVIITPLATFDDALLIYSRVRRLLSGPAPSPSLEVVLVGVTVGALATSWLAAWRFFRTRNIITRLLALVVVLVGGVAMAALYFSGAGELGLW